MWAVRGLCNTRASAVGTSACKGNGIPNGTPDTPCPLQPSSTAPCKTSGRPTSSTPSLPPPPSSRTLPTNLSGPTTRGCSATWNPGPSAEAWLWPATARRACRGPRAAPTGHSPPCLHCHCHGPCIPPRNHARLKTAQRAGVSCRRGSMLKLRGGPLGPAPLDLRESDMGR